jgi:hypothetical protein
VRRCPRCGAETESIKVASGQRVPVNPGWVMVATGEGKGGVTLGRVVHWGTCPGEKPGEHPEKRVGGS